MTGTPATFDRAEMKEQEMQSKDYHQLQHLHNLVDEARKRINFILSPSRYEEPEKSLEELKKIIDRAISSRNKSAAKTGN